MSLGPQLEYCQRWLAHVHECPRCGRDGGQWCSKGRACWLVVHNAMAFEEHMPVHPAGWKASQCNCMLASRRDPGVPGRAVPPPADPAELPGPVVLPGPAPEGTR